SSYRNCRRSGRSTRRINRLHTCMPLAWSLRSNLSRSGIAPIARDQHARVQTEDIAMVTRTSAAATRPFTRRWLISAAGIALGASLAFPAHAQDTIKVGILHSLSGTMAISETTLKDVMLMLIEEQNKKGGLLGKKLEAVVVDPASNWPLFAE